jgi:hypothetical protein
MKDIANDQQKENLSTQAQKEYLLLWRDDGWYNRISAKELQNVMNRCQAWLDRLTEQGKAQKGQALEPKSTVISSKAGRVIADGPFAESKEAIGGYLLIQAESFDEAVAIAKTNPGLAYGSTIEVRQIAEECPLDIRMRHLRGEAKLIAV